MNANEEENKSLSQSFDNLNIDNGFIFDVDHYDPNDASNETVRNEECLPSVFCLLGGKKAATYKRMIYELKMACLGLGLEFRPSEILLDFEAAVIESLRFAFPTAILIGCFFHFGQCLFRKLCDVGLREHYGKDEKLKHWFNLCVALAFIPPDKVEHIFVECILDEAQYAEYPQLEKFSDYMLETWLEGSKSFPISHSYVLTD